MACRDAKAPPPEAREVAQICKLLPLTLGIAGRLVKDLDLQQNWSEVIALMREDRLENGETRSSEDTVIATSLRAITGPHAESARMLLQAFRLVPEDVKCPLAALQCIYAANTMATAGQSSVDTVTTEYILPPVHHLRRVTKILIDRCLLLGPIDQPSVHDLVGDYAMSMTSAAQTQEAHRHMVNILRERRPDRHGWDLGHGDDRLSTYVQVYVGHHIKFSWQKMWSADKMAISCLMIVMIAHRHHKMLYHWRQQSTWELSAPLNWRSKQK